ACGERVAAQRGRALLFPRGAVDEPRDAHALDVEVGVHEIAAVPPSVPPFHPTASTTAERPGRVSGGARGWLARRHRAVPTGIPRLERSTSASVKLTTSQRVARSWERRTTRTSPITSARRSSR